MRNVLRFLLYDARQGRSRFRAWRPQFREVNLFRLLAEIQKNTSPVSRTISPTTNGVGTHDNARLAFLLPLFLAKEADAARSTSFFTNSSTCVRLTPSLAFNMHSFRIRRLRGVKHVVRTLDKSSILWKIVIWWSFSKIFSQLLSILFGMTFWSFPRKNPENRMALVYPRQPRVEIRITLIQVFKNPHGCIGYHYSR